MAESIQPTYDRVGLLSLTYRDLAQLLRLAPDARVLHIDQGTGRYAQLHLHIERPTLEPVAWGNAVPSLPLEAFQSGDPFNTMRGIVTARGDEVQVRRRNRLDPHFADLGELVVIQENLTDHSGERYSFFTPDHARLLAYALLNVAHAIDPHPVKLMEALRQVHGLVPASQEDRPEAQARTPDPDKVICPRCTHQFPAIPVNVQRRLQDLETCGREAPQNPLRAMTAEEIRRTQGAQDPIVTRIACDCSSNALEDIGHTLRAGHRNGRGENVWIAIHDDLAMSWCKVIDGVLDSIRQLEKDLSEQEQVGTQLAMRVQRLEMQVATYENLRGSLESVLQIAARRLHDSGAGTPG